jgi:alpha-ketoglutarate-dependent taurine dioxygenase
LRAVPISNVLGAELSDFDLKRPCGPQEQAELRRLFAEHHLLLVRGQEVTDQDQTRFVGYFGPLHVKRDGTTETSVSNQGGTGVATGQARLIWHQDGTYGPRPGIATSLWAQEVAQDAVPTIYANAVGLLDRLPADLRAQIDQLHVINGKDAKVERTDTRYREGDVSADALTDRVARYEQPIVYETPHTGQKTILVSELFTSHVVELPRDEGEALLQELFARLYAEDNVYTHNWQANDLIIWDNMALHHCRPADMGAAARQLRRQSLDGWYTDDGVLDWPETVVAYSAPD